MAAMEAEAATSANQPTAAVAKEDTAGQRVVTPACKPVQRLCSNAGCEHLMVTSHEKRQVHTELVAAAATAAVIRSAQRAMLQYRDPYAERGGGYGGGYDSYERGSGGGYGSGGGGGGGSYGGSERGGRGNGGGGGSYERGGFVTDRYIPDERASPGGGGGAPAGGYPAERVYNGSGAPPPSRAGGYERGSRGSGYDRAGPPR